MILIFSTRFSQKVQLLVYSNTMYMGVATTSRCGLTVQVICSVTDDRPAAEVLRQLLILWLLISC